MGPIFLLYTFDLVELVCSYLSLTICFTCSMMFSVPNSVGLIAIAEKQISGRGKMNIFL